MPTSQSWTLQTSRTFTTFVRTGVEVAACYYALCHYTFEITSWSQCRLGYCWSFDKIRLTDSIEVLSQLYVWEIIHLHSVPMAIVLDQDLRFTTLCWKALQKNLGTQLNLSTAFHSQTYGQSECTIQILEDMIQACIISFQGNWEDHLALIDFAYNNNYQASIQIAPFESLYNWPCRSLVCWTKMGE